MFYHTSMHRYTMMRDTNARKPAMPRKITVINDKSQGVVGPLTTASL